MNWDGCLVNGIATLKCVPILIQNLINTALAFSGLTAVVFIIVAGFQLLRSGGDPKQVASSKGTLTWAIVGLLLVLFSFFIVNMISYITGVTCIKEIGFTNCN